MAHTLAHRQRRLASTAAVVLSLLVAMFAPAVSQAAGKGDRLRDQRTELNRGINRGHNNLDEVSAQLLQATGALTVAQADLIQAQSQLASMREQVRLAEILDQKMQLKLEAAILSLQNAWQDLREGRGQVVSQRAEVATYAVENYQNNSLDLSSFEAAFNGDSLQDTVNQMQANDTVLDQQDVQLQELQAQEVLLQLTEERVEAAKVEVAKDRAAAAQNLLTKQNLEAGAEAQANEVASQVERLRSARQVVAAAKGNEIKRLQILENERNKVLEELQQLAAQRALQQQGSPKNAGGFLSYPVANTYVTSPYGMRMHPVLRVWKLHDGTDFHAPCGTPVYASANGVVIDEYYNAGYGNRVIVDNGVVKGVSLATSYNHLMSFVAGKGEKVKRGQLIAYSGTTGYSTGCHLHFMVYVNGYAVDPMTWL